MPSDETRPFGLAVIDALEKHAEVERCPTCTLAGWELFGEYIPYRKLAAFDIYQEWARVARDLLRSPALVMIGWKQYEQARHIRACAGHDLGDFKTIRGTPIVIDLDVEFGVRVFPPIDEAFRQLAKDKGHGRSPALLRNRHG